MYRISWLNEWSFFIWITNIIIYYYSITKAVKLRGTFDLWPYQIVGQILTSPPALLRMSGLNKHSGVVPKAWFFGGWGWSIPVHRPKSLRNPKLAYRHLFLPAPSLGRARLMLSYFSSDVAGFCYILGDLLFWCILMPCVQGNCW